MSDIISIMIETQDGRRFFFKNTNIKSILNFANAIKAKAANVQTNKNNIKTIKENINLICDQSYKNSENNFTPTNQPVISNEKISSKKIKQIIQQNFLKKQKISFQEIQYIFRNHNISASVLNQHFAQVRSSLSAQGVGVRKIKNGVYSIV